MTIAITAPAPNPASNIVARWRNSTVDCCGARMRAYLHHMATVVSVRGEIDGINADQVSAYIRRFNLGTNPLVLDLSAVSDFSAAGISILCGLDEDCRAAGVEWTLVPSPAVAEQLGDTRAGHGTHDGNGIHFPIARSVHRALHNLSDAIASRRQQVLPLIQKTA